MCDQMNTFSLKPKGGASDQMPGDNYVGEMFPKQFWYFKIVSKFGRQPKCSKNVNIVNCLTNLDIFSVYQ